MNEHHVREHMLDLVHLMGRDQDRASLVEVVVQQGIVELLAVQNIEAERGFVQHQQPRVHSHDHRQV